MPVERANSPSSGETPTTEPPQPGPAVDFARGVHTEMLETNKNLVNRAQVVLTLDGVILDIVGAGARASPSSLRNVADSFGWSTWVLLAVAGVALVASILCCAQATASTFWKKLFVTATDTPPLEPEHMWFFRDLAKHAAHPETFIARGTKMSEEDEVRARLSQSLAMAPNVLDRARQVNTAFALLAITLIFFALASADYLARVVG
jgi:hypothetical protein